MEPRKLGNRELKGEEEELGHCGASGDVITFAFLSLFIRTRWVPKGLAHPIVSVEVGGVLPIL